MLEKDKLLIRIKELAFKGGEIALSLIDNSGPSLKPDQTVLTKADTAVSQLIREGLDDLLKTKDHILIDEEDKENARYFNQKTMESVPYIWSLDPIDGTMAYANHLPTFGISIGLLNELTPWIGLVYMPLFRELYYCDGHQAFFVQDAFTHKERSSLIKPVDLIITRQSVFLGCDTFLKKYGWDSSFCQLMIQACAVIDLCWPAVGRTCGCFFNSNLWDLAGSWPIIKQAGLDLRSLETGKTLDKISVEAFEGNGTRTWRFREDHILSSERNYPIIKKSLSITPHTTRTSGKS
ncbi:MAG TPA: hypothetical protein DD723_10140 [Candidatus Omnitrophica bacterium]|nr:MAG: hypothetical protein A2Z81_05265 [Omnitrophica WOR_2 bacterium GWA2_45_18]OGX19292.1 MAG: hypothetical protein A2Y04_05600 [Omnitrophica WOR_2 bacterium GWC2_45_7]HBR15877.1 hypothetical protein [Candidatus Omnitrophota bacterium]